MFYFFLRNLFYKINTREIFFKKNIFIETKQIYEHDYLTTISQIKLNQEFVLIKLDEKVHLHRV